MLCSELAQYLDWKQKKSLVIAVVLVCRRRIHIAVQTMDCRSCLARLCAASVGAGLDLESDSTTAMSTAGNVIVGAGARVGGIETSGRVGSEDTIFAEEFSNTILEFRNGSSSTRGGGLVAAVVNVTQIGAVGIDTQVVSSLIEGVADVLEEVFVGSKVSEVASRARVGKGDFWGQVVPGRGYDPFAVDARVRVLDQFAVANEFRRRFIVVVVVVIVIATWTKTIETPTKFSCLAVVLGQLGALQLGLKSSRIREKNIQWTESKVRFTMAWD